MSDEYTHGTATQAPSGPAAAGSGRGRTNKVVTLLIALGVLAIVVGVAAAIVLAVMGGPGEDVEVRTPGGSTPPGGSAPAQQQPPTATNEAAPAVSNSEVFTFRDIFEPLLKPLPKPPAPSDTDTDTATPSSPGTLYLNDIVTEDGVLKAVLELDGDTYTLAAGGTIPDTPWKVLKVTSTQVTMLYGDTQVTLTIGQGITK